MKKRSFLVLLIIILMILSIMLSILSYIKNKKENEEVKLLYPNNIVELHFDYKGKISINKIYEELHNIVIEDIPSVNSDLKKLKNDKKISKYYKKNENINIKIEKVEDFKFLVNILKTINKEELEYEYSEIIQSSCKKDKTKIQFDVKVRYKDCNDIILRIIVYNEENNDSYIKYIPIK